MTTNTPNRWLIAAAGVLMQIALGAVYAWSVFRIPLTKTYGWTVPEVTSAFELAILVLGFAAFAGGLWMRRVGPRTVALSASILYGAGTMLAGISHTLPMLYLTYGVIGGAGIGLAYIVPVATLLRWFPDHRGMITGVAVAGFGAGALITAPIAQYLIDSSGVNATFLILGAAYFVIVASCAFFMIVPPEGYAPPGYRASLASAHIAPAQDLTLRQALGSWQWYGLWMTLFLNSMAGIAIISQASPMAQEVSHVSAATAAAMVGIISIGNGCGRLFWAWLSDAIGRKTVFLTMFGVEALVFLLLSQTSDFSMLALLLCIILLCYGGGFGTMPAFAADYFGSRDIGSIYGLMLTAWGFAGVAGPALIAHFRQATGEYHGVLRIMAFIALASGTVPLLLRKPSPQEPALRSVQHEARG
ncbi:L-lactate MFS transporter [Paludibaculum fermentans]|uniref:L-lactate MFS transporter n=1 Tax=Paludibaculum fermentans TaxID=1473598 RepID=UPI003EBBDE63